MAGSYVFDAMLKPERPYPAGPETLHSSTLGWRMTNPRMPAKWSIPLGEMAELLARITGRAAFGNDPDTICIGVGQGLAVVLEH